MSFFTLGKMAFSIRNLKKSYNGTPVLDNFSLDLKKGKVTAFIGPNGCGKSTLFNLIAKLIDKDSGEVANEAQKQYALVEAFQAE